MMYIAIGILTVIQINKSYFWFTETESTILVENQKQVYIIMYLYYKFTFNLCFRHKLMN